MHFKSKKEHSYVAYICRSEYNYILGAACLVHSDLRIYRISYFLLDLIGIQAVLFLLYLRLLINILPRKLFFSSYYDNDPHNDLRASRVYLPISFFVHNVFVVTNIFGLLHSLLIITQYFPVIYQIALWRRRLFTPSRYLIILRVFFQTASQTIKDAGFRIVLTLGQCNQCWSSV